MLFVFLGTSISWVGITSDNLGTPTSSTYSIDDQTPINFTVPAAPNGANYLFNQILFKTGQLSPGQHKLVVTYLGNSTTTPLNLNYFVQEDATSSTSSSNAPTSTNVPSGASSSSSSSMSNVGSSTANSSTTIDRKPTGAIIGAATSIGGLVLISLLLALFFFIRRRRNRRVQALNEKSHIGASLEVVDPFIALPSTHPTSAFLLANYISNGQLLHSQSIPSKFAQRGQPSNFASTSNSGGIPPLTVIPLRSQLSLPTIIPPSLSHLDFVGSQTHFIDGTMTRSREAATDPLMQRSTSPRLGGGNARILRRHEDSGVRMPPAEEDVTDLPPLYTPG